MPNETMESNIGDELVSMLHEDIEHAEEAIREEQNRTHTPWGIAFGSVLTKVKAEIEMVSDEGILPSEKLHDVEVNLEKITNHYEDVKNSYYQFGSKPGEITEEKEIPIEVKQELIDELKELDVTSSL